MNRADVVVAVAERAGVSQQEARRCLDALLGLVCDQVAAGGEVNLTGYLKISTVHATGSHRSQPPHRRGRRGAGPQGCEAPGRLQAEGCGRGVTR